MTRKKQQHTKNFFRNQIPKKFVKQTKTSRGLNFAFQGPILSENGANMVRNVFLIFIHDKLSINEVRIKVTQANVNTCKSILWRLVEYFDFIDFKT